MENSEIQLTDRHQYDILDNEDVAALEASKLTKLRKKINADTWTDHMEDLMKSWGEKAAGNRELHLNSANKWKRFSDSFSVPLILLTTLSGVTTFGAMAIDDYEYWMYGVGCLNLISAFLAGVSKYYRPDEKVQDHTYTARSFGSFYRQMILELGMSREDRQPADTLSQWAKQEFDRLLKEAPTIPGEVIEAYKSKHKNDENKPDITLDKFTIEVYGRTV